MSEKSGVIQSVGPFEEQVRVQKDEDPQRLGIDIQKDSLEQSERMADKQLEMNEKLKDKEIEVKKQLTKNTTAPKSGPGRPADKGDTDSRKQKKRRSDISKPVQGSSVGADLIEHALSSRSVIDHYLKPKFLESLSKTNLRQLTKDEKNTYNKLVERIWALSNPHSEEAVTPKWVEKIAKMIVDGSIEKLDDSNSVNSTYGSLVGEYREDNHRFPSERISRELFATALVLFYE